MNRKVKIWGGAATTTLFFVSMAWVVGAFLELGGTNRWILRGGMTVLGLAAGFVVHRLLSQSLTGSEEPTEAGDTLSDAVDEIFSEVRSRLASAGDAGGVGQRPVVLLMGPRGSTKTSVMEHSGVDAELLAGEVERDGEVPATEAANVWLGEDTVFVEAAGDVLDSPGSWERVVRHLRPSRLAAVLGRDRQASRVAVVCFPCGKLRSAGASDAVPAAAREIRDRLRELAQGLGIQLPVYVLFTRADELPYFREFAENLTDSEAHQVLGATVPVAGRDRSAAYADRESRRLTREFDGIFHSLSLWRPELLRRETDDEVRAGIYEFPRELRKVRDPAVRFLVELCRPSQLGITPFLRGFYFTGVRPVVRESATGRAKPSPSLGGDQAVGATMAFDPSQARPAAPEPQESGTRRRVPQWVFLRRLFRRLFLGDRVARAVTGGGRRVSVLRRLLAGAGVAMAFLLLVGMTTSFFQNRGLRATVTGAMEDVGSQPTIRADEPSFSALAELDTLGRSVDRLREWETEGAPWRYRWFLYTGSELLPPTRRVYFHHFGPGLGDPTRRALVASLRALGGGSGDGSAGEQDTPYQAAYSGLKAYLVMTSQAERSDPDFLVPVLMRHWPGREGADGRLQELVRAQFETYARELQHGDPYQLPAEAELVADVREFLRRFASVDRFYQSMIARASQESEAIRFSDAFPGSGSVLRTSHAVPGAYTEQGWRFIQTNLNNVDSLLAQETWVTGGQAFSETELSELSEQLRQRYVRDYVDHWREFIASASVQGLSSVGSAAATLSRLSDNRSPLLQLLSLVSQHTRVDSATVGQAFQPVHALTPADTADRFVVEANRGYVNALGALQSAVEQVSTLTGSARQQARTAAVAAAQAVEGEVRKMAQSFSVEGEASRVGNAVTSALGQPGSRVGRLLQRLPVAEVNGRARQFCQGLAPVTSAYPFDRGASRSVSIDALDSALKPGESALWSFYDDALGELLVRQGNSYRPRPGAPVEVTDRFLDFFNRAAAISRALYGSDGSGPALNFLLKLETSDALPSVTVSIDGARQTYTQTFSESQNFRWVGQQARYAAITGMVDGSERTLVQVPEGTWALFRLLGLAEWERLGNQRHSLRWPAQGRPAAVTGELILETAAPILNPAYLSRLDCVSTVAR